MEQARVEAKPAAILAAKVVGYAHLLGVDQAATIAAVAALGTEIVAPLAATHGGRVVRSIGARLVAQFDSAAAAVACAIAVQRELADPQPDASAARLLVLSVGVDLGAVADDVADVRGEAVDIALYFAERAEPGGVLVSGAARDALPGRLGQSLELVGGAEGKGDEKSVRAYSVRLDGTPATGAAPDWRLRIAAWAADIPERLHVPVAAGAVLVVAVIAFGVFHFWPRQAPPAEAVARASIAVLPFANAGVDTADGRLAAGLSDDIIGDLARYSDLDVIARDSVEPYRGKPADAREVGGKLGVRYVLAGSLQRQGERIVVVAALTDTASGEQIWSERWDRDLKEVFAVEREMVGHAAAGIAGSDRRRANTEPATERQRPTDLAAYDLVIQAYDSLRKGAEAETAKGIAFADEAIGRDPDFARAYIAKAWLLQDLAKYRKRWSEAAAEMEALARTAIRLDPYDADGHILLASALGMLGRNSEAAAETDRALPLGPGSADVLNAVADTMALVGRPEEGAALCDRSFRLNPLAPDWYFSNCVANLYFAHRFQEAVAAVDRGSAAADPTPSMLVWKAASLAELGQTEAAKDTVAGLQKLYVEVSFEWLLNTGWNFERAKEEEEILASAKKVGLRLCATQDEIEDFPAPKRLGECEKAAPRD